MRKTSQPAHSYDCLSLTSAAAGYLKVDFKKADKTFATFEGGFTGGVGTYTGRGRAHFSKPVEGLIGKPGAFVVEVASVIVGTAHVQITGVDFIGNCSTGGFGAEAGVGAGGGVFKKG
jgi:hypothetical protein